MTALPSEPSDEMLERMIVAWFEDVNKTSVQKADCPEFYERMRLAYKAMLHQYVGGEKS